MSGQKPYDIAISVDMRFLDDQSAPAENRYAFAYTITIANHAIGPNQPLSGCLKALRQTSL